MTDTHNELERIYGLHGEFLCLIRPDDHIGLIQSPINEPTLREYLRHMSPSPINAAASAAANEVGVA